MTLGWKKPDRPRRLRLFADAYGLSERDRARFIKVIRKRVVDHIEGIRRMAQAGDPTFERIVQKGTCGARRATCACWTPSATNWTRPSDRRAPTTSREPPEPAPRAHDTAGEWEPDVPRRNWSAPSAGMHAPVAWLVWKDFEGFATEPIGLAFACQYIGVDQYDLGPGNHSMGALAALISSFCKPATGGFRARCLEHWRRTAEFSERNPLKRTGIAIAAAGLAAVFSWPPAARRRSPPNRTR
ncbi:hypothetical protein GCM10029992_30220 [Glycomyces albus]